MFKLTSRSVPAFFFFVVFCFENRKYYINGAYIFSKYIHIVIINDYRLILCHKTHPLWTIYETSLMAWFFYFYTFEPPQKLIDTPLNKRQTLKLLRYVCYDIITLLYGWQSCFVIFDLWLNWMQWHMQYVGENL